MKNIREQYEKTYQSFPKLSEMKKLYHFGYWDGPLSGMCLVDGQKYWFDCIEEWLDNNFYPSETDQANEDWEPPWYRRFLIWKLTDEQQAYIETRHEKFQRMVGRHTDYDENGSRPYFHYNETITTETVARFYEESKTEKTMSIMPTSDDQILGWYEW